MFHPHFAVWEMSVYMLKFPKTFSKETSSILFTPDLLPKLLFEQMSCLVMGYAHLNVFMYDSIAES